jgi:5-methylcytosine-specific restriction enzyme subunit McrC
MLEFASDVAVVADSENGQSAGIPIRNIWLLLFYASDLFRQRGHANVGIEDTPDDIADLVAEILAHMVERRLARNLSFGYIPRKAVLSRVRGHIDQLTTERRQLLARGVIACRFDDLTINTVRNRYVQAALEVIARLVRKDSSAAHRCRALANTLKRLGVSGERPTRSEVSTDRCGRHDAEDQMMVAAAKLAFDLALPTEEHAHWRLLYPERDIVWLRSLFERAVGGFYDVVLSPQGWNMTAGKRLNWQITGKTDGIDAILPTMKTDVVLDHCDSGRRIVIDTKFTSLLTSGQYREETLRSGYIYQLYAYLRSQVGAGDPMADNAEGLLLHPAVGKMIDESVVIQGHRIRFATVDLAASTNDIRAQLLKVVANTEACR